MVSLKKVMEVLDAQVVVGAKELNREVNSACGSDISAIVFVRDKHPEQEVLLAAKAKNIPVLYTRCTMFEACGRLYTLGLRGCSPKDSTEEL